MHAPPKPPRASPLDLAGVVGASLAVAASAPLARAAVGVPSIAIAAGRCLVGALCVWAVAPRATLRALAGLTARQRASLAGGAALLAIHFALFLGGLANTSLPAAVALVSLEPLAVVLAAWIAFRLPPTRMELAGILVATMGALVIAHDAGNGENKLVGDLLVLAAVVFYGAYVAAARGLRDLVPMFPYAASVFSVSFVVLAIPAALALHAEPPAPTSSFLYVVALGIVSTFIGHTLIQRSARHVSPSIVALISPGETAGSIAIGAFAQGAWPTRNEWIGVAFVLSGALLAVRRPAGDNAPT